MRGGHEIKTEMAMSETTTASETRSTPTRLSALYAGWNVSEVGRLNQKQGVDGKMEHWSDDGPRRFPLV